MTDESTTAVGDVPGQAAPPRRGPGRPRHADTEERAYRAVLELFGRKGWSGLSLDGVATHAGIGKSSIYLRWKDKRDLLLDALRDLEHRYVSPEETENLPLRDYLVEHVTARGVLYIGTNGPALSYLHAAALANPVEFHEISQESISRGILTLGKRLEQAVRDGELPPDTPTRQLLDGLEGAVLMHVLYSDPQRRDELREGMRSYAETLVDMALDGLRR